MTRPINIWFLFCSNKLQYYDLTTGMLSSSYFIDTPEDTE